MKENQKEISSLEKKFKIKIPHNKVSSKMEEDFLQLSKTLKVAGFRPGKVPISFVKSKYLNQVLTNVSEKLIREEGNKKFDKEGYKIASQPKVTLLSEFKENSDLEAEFSFEILPEIKLNDFKKLELETEMLQLKRLYDDGKVMHWGQHSDSISAAAQRNLNTYSELLSTTFPRSDVDLLIAATLASEADQLC